jgi:coproporphyrinogen III oxidase-like Fe-S oxidoreductase
MPYVDDGLVTMITERICLTPRGRLLVKNVAACFDAYTYPG